LFPLLVCGLRYLPTLNAALNKPGLDGTLLM
jgi:hypothetical protein